LRGWSIRRQPEQRLGVLRLLRAGKASVSGWTIDTLAVHHAALRESDEKFQLERDRRYAEVATEREKALKIKETADLAALGLAREIQTYKDEKANQLREQINTERGNYATQSDLRASVEIAVFMASQQGKSTGNDKVWSYIFAGMGIIFGVFGIAVALVSIYLKANS
jgi:hypothetical protein